MTTPRTLGEIADSVTAVLDDHAYGTEHLHFKGIVLAALREAADAALAGRCHCRLEGEPGRETILHECQIHAEVRLRYAGMAADAARAEVIAKANEAWPEGHDEPAVNVADLKCRIKDLLLEMKAARQKEKR